MTFEHFSREDTMQLLTDLPAAVPGHALVALTLAEPLAPSAGQSWD